MELGGAPAVRLLVYFFVRGSKMAPRHASDGPQSLPDLQHEHQAAPDYFSFFCYFVVHVALLLADIIVLGLVLVLFLVVVDAVAVSAAA
eukprot:5708252-Karenia_brevis.AAC.1